MKSVRCCMESNATILQMSFANNLFNFCNRCAHERSGKNHEDFYDMILKCNVGSKYEYSDLMDAAVQIIVYSNKNYMATKHFGIDEFKEYFSAELYWHIVGELK